MADARDVEPFRPLAARDRRHVRLARHAGKRHPQRRVEARDGFRKRHGTLVITGHDAAGGG